MQLLFHHLDLTLAPENFQVISNLIGNEKVSKIYICEIKCSFSEQLCIHEACNASSQPFKTIYVGLSNATVMQLSHISGSSTIHIYYTFIYLI